jgi:hypothetical protein
MRWSMNTPQSPHQAPTKYRTPNTKMFSMDTIQRSFEQALVLRQADEIELFGSSLNW